MYSFREFLVETQIEYKDWQQSLLSNPLLAKGVRLCNEIEKLGGQALIVGGAVRDLILKKPVHDIDIATNVPIATIEQKFHAIDIGKSKDFGIVTVQFEGDNFEVANYRTEEGYSDSRRPDKVNIVQDFHGDSARRDFTINALGINKDGIIIDYHNGVKHLEQGIIKAVGDASERFSEDALRLMRAIRFAARMGFKIDPDTKSAIVELSHKIKNLAPERIHQELLKTAGEGGNVLADYIEHLDEVGLLNYILPELKVLQDFEHDPIHHPEGGVWDHVLAAVKASESTDPITNLAILFHDIGKAVTRGYKETGEVTYHGHEEAGVPIFDTISSRLRFSNSERDAIAYAIEHHMKGHLINQMADKKIIPIRQSPHWDTFKHVVKADAKARLHLWDPESFQRDMDRIEAVYKKFGDTAAFEAKMSKLIDGRKVMQIANVKGAEIGRIKNLVRDKIVELEFQVTPEQVEDMIRQFAAK